MPQKYLDFIKKHLVWVLLGLIVIWGFVLRVYQLDEQSYWIDEGFTLNAVLETLEKGYPILDSGFHYSRELLNTYLIAGSVKLFGFNSWATRLVSVLFGTGFIVLIFFFVKELFKNEKLALLSSFLISISYWEIAWSRQARMYILLQFFFFASLYVFWLLLNKYSHKKMALLLLTTLGAVLSHAFGYLLLFVYLLVGFLKFVNPLEKKKILWQRRGKIVNFIQKYKWYFLFVSVLIVPIIGTQFYKFFINRVLEEGLTESNAYTTFLYLNGLIDFYTIPLVLGLVGLFWYIFKEKIVYSGFYLFLAYLVPFSIIIFSVDIFSLRYLFFIYPILLIFASYFICNIISISKKFKYIQVLILIILITVGYSAADFVNWPSSYYDLEFRTPQPDFKSTYEAIINDGWDPEKDIIISPYTPMDRIYLGKVDYWLPISYVGPKSEIKSQIINNQEKYNNANIVGDLFEINNTGSIYLVIDEMTINRTGPSLLLKLLDLNLLLFHSTSNKNLNNIWVFKMNQNE